MCGGSWPSKDEGTGHAVTIGSGQAGRAKSLSENPSPPAPLPASGARGGRFWIGSKGEPSGCVFAASTRPGTSRRRPAGMRCRVPARRRRCRPCPSDLQRCHRSRPRPPYCRWPVRPHRCRSTRGYPGWDCEWSASIRPYLRRTNMPCPRVFPRRSHTVRRQGCHCQLPRRHLAQCHILSVHDLVHRSQFPRLPPAASRRWPDRTAMPCGPRRQGRYRGEAGRSAKRPRSSCGCSCRGTGRPGPPARRVPVGPSAVCFRRRRPA